MKIEQGSIIDEKVTHFPARYIFYTLFLWVCIIIALIYWMVKV